MKEFPPRTSVPFKADEKLPLYDAIWLTGDSNNGNDLAPEWATEFITSIEKKALEARGKPTTVSCVIKCDGGDERELFSIKNHFDRIRKTYPTIKIRTIADGYANSVATTLVAMGDKGERLAFPNTEFLIHDSYEEGEAGEDLSWKDLRKKAFNLRRAQRITFKILSEATGRPIKDFYALASEQTLNERDALALGIIDRIIT